MIYLVGFILSILRQMNLKSWQWTDFECEGAKVQRAHQPRSVCQGKKKSFKNLRLRNKSSLSSIRRRAPVVQSSVSNNRSLEMSMGARVLRPQDSCIVHQSQPATNDQGNNYGATFCDQQADPVNDEEEMYESASEMDEGDQVAVARALEQTQNSRQLPQSSIGDTVFHRTAEEASRFVDRLLKMEIPSKGTPALQRAARRALRRYGHAKLEHRLLGILGHEDIVTALRRIDPRSYKDAVASEYNLRWQAVGRMIDYISQWLFTIGYILFCFITYTVALLEARQPPDKNWI
eukprot:TRINITY_DN4057_c0_g1_i1.p1 TRINITY_DN4057_c0_g1~~TRINITY_DN4057_c0_g1_i1.p1  ORF type:complete len:291 (+),score=11.50 TRINITY_DN4057_c0_g1_i1:169-1041(+)